MALGFGFYPSHPGEVVKDELEERGISQRKFAESIVKEKLDKYVTVWEGQYGMEHFLFTAVD